MITKITSKNADLYYAPRFAEITEAFAVDYIERPELYENNDGPIVIKSLEDYFLYLTDIANLQVGAKNVENAYLLVAPADEDIFTINANTRTIDVPAFVKKNGIGVYGDHRAEMIVMTIDRYFDHEDFLQDNFAINWNFTPANSRTPLYEQPQAVEAFAPNEELNPGKITFGFIITHDMTPQKGTLTFSVTIYDKKSDDIVYSFNTLTASVVINDTLTLDKATVVKSDTKNYVGRLTNSLYTDNTVSPVGNPYWISGDRLAEDDSVSGLKAGDMSGLLSSAYIPAAQDASNNYDEGLKLTARAKVDPNTADLVYKWTFSPIDGTVVTGRDYETITNASDFIDVLDLVNDDSIYYVKNQLGSVDVRHPLEYNDAVEYRTNHDGEQFTFVVRGTSFVAHSAGSYQVHSQARIGAGPKYVKFMGTVNQLKVNTNYYKQVGNVVDTANPVQNEAAVALFNSLEDGESLCELVSSARNSEEVSSITLTIPAAIRPNVDLGVQSAVRLEGDLSVDDEYTGATNYFTYISNTELPIVTATVTLPEGSTNDDKAGMFAVELIKSNTADMTLTEINEKIANGKLQFRSLNDGVFTFTPESIEQDDYIVRAINRRNGTYSVSLPSEEIHTSFVAPSISAITVEALKDDLTRISVLDKGEFPLIDGERTRQDLEINRIIDHWDFELIDESTNNLDGAVISYYVEEVDIDNNGNIIQRDLPAEQDQNELDLRKIEPVIGTDNICRFTITGDPGYYRIKTVNRYNGTARTAYTAIFGIKSYM